MNEMAEQTRGCAPEERPLAWAVGVLALVCVTALLVAAAVYARGGEALLDRLAVNVSEVLMEQAVRLEEGGDYEAAIARYRMALDARWEGRQNRALTLKRLGTRLWLEGRPEEAVPYLDESAGMAEAPVTVHEPRVSALVELERWEEAKTALEDWRAALGADVPEELEASVAFYQGRIARAQGDLEAAKRFFKRSEELSPGGRAASALAYILFNEGRFEEALSHLDQYLLSGADGPRADYARELRALALRRLEQQRKRK